MTLAIFFLYFFTSCGFSSSIHRNMIKTEKQDDIDIGYKVETVRIEFLDDNNFSILAKFKNIKYPWFFKKIYIPILDEDKSQGIKSSSEKPIPGNNNNNLKWNEYNKKPWQGNNGYPCTDFVSNKNMDIVIKKGQENFYGCRRQDIIHPYNHDKKKKGKITFPNQKFYFLKKRIKSENAFYYQRSNKIECVAKYNDHIFATGSPRKIKFYYGCNIIKNYYAKIFEIKEYNRTEGSIKSIKFSRNGKKMGVHIKDEKKTGKKETITIICLNDLNSQINCTLENIDECTSFEFGRENIFVGNHDGTLKIYESYSKINEYTKPKERKLHDGAINYILYGPYANLLTTCGDDGLVKFWNSKEFSKLGQLSFYEDEEKGKKIPNSISFNLNGDELLIGFKRQYCLGWYKISLPDYMKKTKLIRDYDFNYSLLKAFGCKDYSIIAISFLCFIVGLEEYVFNWFKFAKNEITQAAEIVSMIIGGIGLFWHLIILYNLSCK